MVAKSTSRVLELVVLSPADLEMFSDPDPEFPARILEHPSRNTIAKFRDWKEAKKTYPDAIQRG